MKTKTKRTKVQRSKKETAYPAYYLAVILSFVILLEGFLMGAATTTDWEHGMQILDVSAGVSNVVSDFVTTVEPMLDQVSYVNQFYQLAASETIAMLDSSDFDLLLFPKGVFEFYDLASVEMADLLDMSDRFEFLPQVAGAAIFK